MSAWTALERELGLWAAGGRRLPFWWRDDDAALATPALDALLGVLDGAPVALAVVPEGATAGLAGRLAREPQVAVLQHGRSHRNAAPPGARKAELGDDRALDALAGDVRAGRAALVRRFGGRALPVLVPPWNRIAPALVPVLPSLGIAGLSADRPRPPVPGLVQAHAAVDPIDWAGGRRFLGEGAALARLAAAAAAARTGERPGPVGLLTHHLATDEDGWSFLRRLAAILARHPAVAWLDPARLFAGAADPAMAEAAS